MARVALAFVNHLVTAGSHPVLPSSGPPEIWELNLLDSKDEQLTLFLQLPPSS